MFAVVSFLFPCDVVPVVHDGATEVAYHNQILEEHILDSWRHRTSCHRRDAKGRLGNQTDPLPNLPAFAFSLGILRKIPRSRLAHELISRHSFQHRRSLDVRRFLPSSSIRRSTRIRNSRRNFLRNAMTRLLPRLLIRRSDRLALLILCLRLRRAPKTSTNSRRIRARRDHD